MNQIEALCAVLSKELSAMRCPDCGKMHHVSVSQLQGETVYSPSFPTLLVGVEEGGSRCKTFLSNASERAREARKDLLRRNGLA